MSAALIVLAATVCATFCFVGIAVSIARVAEDFEGYFMVTIFGLLAVITGGLTIAVIAS